ncbi:MAG TPA: FAD-dependent oxidoreductase [Pseudonocardiaceae bacterium]|nr:FAD-dependent oxidoreductase [Pseudonocardiaceae bacterium]
MNVDAGCALIDPEPFPRPPSATWASAGGVRSQRRDPREWPLTVRAAARWPTLAEELGTDLGFVQSGHLHVIDDPAHAETLYTRVTAERVAGLVPGIDDSVYAAAYTPGDGQADPQLTGIALRGAATERGATHYRTRARRVTARDGNVTGVDTDDGHVGANSVIVAAGSWTADLLADWGIELPLRLRIAQMIRTEPPRPRSPPPSPGRAGGSRSNRPLPATTSSVVAGRASGPNTDTATGSTRPPWPAASLPPARPGRA